MKNSNQFQDKSMEYIPLEQSDESNVEIKRSRNKKIYCTIFGLLVVLSILLIVFLTPRQPSVILESGDCDIEDTFTCGGNFNFKNNNYYQVNFKNPNINLYWVPYDGQSVGEVCYNNGELCDSEVSSFCAIKIGEFSSNYDFDVKKRSSKEKRLELLNSTSQEYACISWMLINGYSNYYPRLLTSGHVYAKSNLKDFGKIKINEQYYYLY